VTLVSLTSAIRSTSTSRCSADPAACGPFRTVLDITGWAARSQAGARQFSRAPAWNRLAVPVLLETLG
jgi:hypothetical protein